MQKLIAFIEVELTIVNFLLRFYPNLGGFESLFAWKNRFMVCTQAMQIKKLATQSQFSYAGLKVYSEKE